jgi:hypothetical protein
METEVQISLLFLGAGLLAYIIIPGLLVIWDRVLDYMAGCSTTWPGTRVSRQKNNHRAGFNPLLLLLSRCASFRAVSPVTEYNFHPIEYILYSSSR